MKLRDRKKVYRAAMQNYGLKAQKIVLMEECAELIQATAKTFRVGQEDYDHFAEELADVEIMIEQMKFFINWELLEAKVALHKDRKLHNLKKILGVKG